MSSRWRRDCGRSIRRIDTAERYGGTIRRNGTAERYGGTGRRGLNGEQSLQQFVNQSPWDTRAVREALAGFVVEHAAPGGSLIVDDTGFPKQGRHSGGVTRQYNGTLGKVGNCQIGVTLQYADGLDVFCLDAALYLPPSVGRRPPPLSSGGSPRRRRLPADVGYQPKWQLALGMIECARQQGFTGTVLADRAFGTRQKLSRRFAAWRVRPAHRLSAGQEPQPACWLLVEWPADVDAPAKSFLSNLPPNTSLKRLVHTAKDRWWIEHSFRQMKGELGLDHFVTRSPCAAQEGRTWTGWHHHVTLVMLADLFLVMRRRNSS